MWLTKHHQELCKSKDQQTPCRPKIIDFIIQIINCGSGPGCLGGFRSGDLRSYDITVWEVSGSGPGCQSGYRSGTYEAMTSQCGRSVVQVLVVRVDIGVVTYEAMTSQCGRSVVQVLVVRVNIGVVTYEAMTPQCGRSVFRSWLSEWI